MYVIHGQDIIVVVQQHYNKVTSSVAVTGFLLLRSQLIDSRT